MQKSRITTIAMIAVGVISFAALLACFLSLHDIFRDYASPAVVQAYAGAPDRPCRHGRAAIASGPWSGSAFCPCSPSTSCSS
ncbi:MAG: hypothetical protein HC888_15080 [Candidatus Competibacteraceae bacterium]|nr:hypothetical protein [Candidatus Competibacteraceae bacterium]